MLWHENSLGPGLNLIYYFLHYFVTKILVIKILDWINIIKLIILKKLIWIVTSSNTRVGHLRKFNRNLSSQSLNLYKTRLTIFRQIFINVLIKLFRSLPAFKLDEETKAVWVSLIYAKRGSSSWPLLMQLW